MRMKLTLGATDVRRMIITEVDRLTGPLGDIDIDVRLLDQNGVELPHFPSIDVEVVSSPADATVTFVDTD